MTRAGGLLKLPPALRRDLLILFCVKLAMLGVLYLVFFAHHPPIDVAAHLAAGG